MLFQSNGICPVCKTHGQHWCTTQDWEYRSTTDFYSYLRCPSCYTIFVKEVNQEALSTIYPANYYSFSGRSGSAVFKLKDFWDRQFFTKILKKIAAPSLAILDIGGGTGDVLDTLKNADKRVAYTEIIDIDANARQLAEKKGHVYTHATIEEYTTDRKFDVILLLNIIEHVANPAQVIEKSGNLLQKGGIIIIKTPNADSLDARLFKNYYWGGLHCPRHWIIFSDKSFRMMIESSRLSLNNIRFTQGAPFWAWSVLNLFRKKDIRQQKKPLIEHPFFAPLSIFFAMLDIVRSVGSKTSQMFIILSKQ